MENSGPQPCHPLVTLRTPTESWLWGQTQHPLYSTGAFHWVGNGYGYSRWTPVSRKEEYEQRVNFHQYHFYARERELVAVRVLFLPGLDSKRRNDALSKRAQLTSGTYQLFCFSKRTNVFSMEKKWASASSYWCYCYSNFCILKKSSAPWKLAITGLLWQRERRKKQTCN